MLEPFLGLTWVPLFCGSSCICPACSQAWGIIHHHLGTSVSSPPRSLISHSVDSLLAPIIEPFTGLISPPTKLSLQSQHISCLYQVVNKSWLNDNIPIRLNSVVSKHYSMWLYIWSSKVISIFLLWDKPDCLLSPPEFFFFLRTFCFIAVRRIDYHHFARVKLCKETQHMFSNWKVTINNSWIRAEFIMEIQKWVVIKALHVKLWVM